MLLKVQSSLDDIYLIEMFGFVELYFCTIVLHEFIKVHDNNENMRKDPLYKFLDNWRQRFLKKIPNNGSRLIKRFSREMGIDFDHYVYDTYVIKNKNDNKIVGFNFGIWDLIKASKEDIDNFSLLANVLVDAIEKYENDFETKIINDKIITAISKAFNSRIKLKKYPYSSAVMFNNLNLKDVDKYIIMFYYYFFSVFKIFDDIILSIEVVEINDKRVILILKKVFLKLKADLISNFRDCLSQTRGGFITEIIQAEIDDKIFDKHCFTLNRNVRNNLHYGETTFVSESDYSRVELFQRQYFDIVLRNFDNFLSIKLGIGYKIIRWIADHTDENVLEKKRKEKLMHKSEVS